MSPIKSIEAIDPDSVEWQGWKTGGRTDRNEAITKVADQTLLAIKEKGAAKLTFEGVDPVFGSPSVEANSWSQTLRRRFKEDGYDVQIKTDNFEDKTELNITIKS